MSELYRAPDVFQLFCSHFHQDIFVLHETFEDAIEWALEDFKQHELIEIENYLALVTGNNSNNISLKKLLKKQLSGMWFENESSAKEFLILCLEVVHLRIHRLKIYNRENFQA